MYKWVFGTLLIGVLMQANASTYAPVKGWRACPVSVTASSDQAALAPLLHGQDAEWTPTPRRSEWMSIRLTTGRRLLLTFTCVQGKTPVYAVLERSSDSANGPWETVNVVRPKGRLDKFEFDRHGTEWWRVRFAFRKADEPSEYKVSDIALHSLDASGRKDYWLVVGASIQAQSIRQKTFHDMVTERFPGYDPVIFNLAVGGWRSDHLRKALPGFLKDHPNASYVGIHIGGNNVSQKRPYPGGVDDLRADLIAILDMIKASGKTPILSRLSYRAYKDVTPEENGSGPYVTAIYDPLIKQYCPDFFDASTGKGIVDGYAYFKAHQDELLPDGVHVTKTGEESWNRLWAEHSGGVIYSE